MCKNILIHVGKCGGSTCREAILRSQIVIDKVVHIRQPPIDLYAKYFFIIRNPISRAISAFNWRLHLVQSDAQQRNRFAGEFDILLHYSNMNALSEALYFDDGTDNSLAQGNFRSIHHLGESISFYLEELLGNITPDQIGGVIRQETLDEDLLRIFNVANSSQRKKHSNKIPPEMLLLSKTSISHLHRFLKKDFECLDLLEKYGKINPSYFSSSSERQFTARGLG